MYKCKYFKLQELVCPHVYEKYGEKAWEFFDKNFLKDLDTVREVLGVPIIINNWKAGGSYSESGNRCTKCSIVSSNIEKGTLNMSAHNLFEAVDMKPKGLTIKESVEKIMDNSHRFKAIKRIEDPDYTSTWLHVDVRGHHEGIKLFKP